MVLQRLLFAQFCWLLACAGFGLHLHTAWVLLALLPTSVAATAAAGASVAGPAGAALGGGLAAIAHLNDQYEEYLAWTLQHQHLHPPTVDPNSLRRPPAPMRTFSRPDFSQRRDFMNEKEFREKFGLSHEAFDYLLSLIKDQITDDEGGRGGNRNSEGPLPPELKLAATLRWLRGASYHDLIYADGFGMSRATFYRTWRVVCVAIVKQPALAMKLMPAIAAWEEGDPSRLARLAAGFGRFTDGCFSHCVGAIDGVQVRAARPASSTAAAASRPRANSASPRNRPACRSRSSGRASARTPTPTRTTRAAASTRSTCRRSPTTRAASRGRLCAPPARCTTRRPSTCRRSPAASPGASDAGT